jgi:hypothetical protein
MFNKGKIEELNTEIQRLNSLVEGLSKFGSLGILEVSEEISRLDKDKSTLNEELLNLQKEISETKKSLIETQEIAMLQEVGVYQYTSILETSEGYSEKIVEIQAQIKDRNIANGGAITAAQGWSVNGSTSEGAKMIKEFSQKITKSIEDLQLPILDKLLSSKYGFLSSKCFCEKCGYVAKNQHALSCHKRGSCGKIILSAPENNSVSPMNILLQTPQQPLQTPPTQPVVQIPVQPQQLIQPKITKTLTKNVIQVKPENK